jgi:gliding motility-associated lipoprotein GldH
VVLSDNTGKWLGKGQSNLLSYERNFIRGAKLKPGNYTLEFSQNMRDEKLKSVSDIGVKVRRSGKVY